MGKNISIKTITGTRKSSHQMWKIQPLRSWWGYFTM